MTIPFLDREDERRRLRRFLGGGGGGLAVVYGRRRCGKSRLIQEVAGANDVYFLADQRDPALQVHALAEEIGRAVQGFASAQYGSWISLLDSLHARVDRRLNVLLDEFPYLAGASPELPSLIQRQLDMPGRKGINLLLCGSSQRMMHGLVLDRTAPLYGRAQEILRIVPLRPGWIMPALGLSGEAAVQSYAVWGGVPRYWELARSCGSLGNAIRELVLDRRGVLHEEPARLLLDEMRTAGLSYSLLSLIGAGCRRLSEIAGRLGRPAGSLTRPLSNLIDLGYVRKEVPFGEDARSSKHTFYRIDDPFLSFFFRLVPPNQSLLELGAVDAVEAGMREVLRSHVAQVWEDLARMSVPFLKPGRVQWGPAGRWWGAGEDGKPLEFDVVAESLDRRAVLIGEAKWSDSAAKLAATAQELRARVVKAPFVKGRRVICCVWVKRSVKAASDAAVITPGDVLDALK
ncbi:MAG: ATP-binding protein [Acidobacteriota bacterium]